MSVQYMHHMVYYERVAIRKPFEKLANIQKKKQWQVSLTEMADRKLEF